MSKKSAPKDVDAQESEVVKTISDDEYQRRIMLDVSDPDYINPSLDHYKV